MRQNVKRLRGATQYKELSERLAAIGRPVPALGIRRIESGERRVDVDDLMAFAVVFDVSPLALLLPADGEGGLSSRLTGVPGREVAHNTQWLWALGQEPLRISATPERAARERTIFRVGTLPEIEPRGGGAAVGGSEDDALREVAQRLLTQGIGEGDASS